MQHKLHQSSLYFFLLDENLSLHKEEASDSENEEKDDGKSSTLQLSDCLGFKVEPEVASLVLQLRQKWNCLFLRRMRAPSKPWSQIDEVSEELLTLSTLGKIFSR